jgi:hypothetical protein
MQSKPIKLIVVAAFDKDDEGEFVSAFGPAEQQSEDRAVRLAESLAGKHAGVIAWSRDAKPDIGEYGPPTILFQNGEVPEME